MAAVALLAGVAYAQTPEELEAIEKAQSQYPSCAVCDLQKSKSPENNSDQPSSNAWKLWFQSRLAVLPTLSVSVPTKSWRRISLAVP